MTELPRIMATAHGHQLVVDGTPTILLGGQLHNSTPSAVDGLAEVFARLAAMRCSLVVGGVSWALMEPQPGQFDFELVDAQCRAARRVGIRLVLLWFGAFKNAVSTYAPAWVRADPDRYPRAVARGSSLFSYPGAMRKAVLSVFSPELRAADTAAFEALMGHLAEHDRGHTVVMVQVENEVGLLGDSRDRCALAEKAWAGTVPSALLPYRRYAASGTWAEVFGDDWQAEEIFMAWSFGSYVEALASAGKRRKELPMYANAWLGPQPGQDVAGQYPSGGPGARVLDVWKTAAPSLALLGPDVYVDDAKAGMAPYVRADNPVFVPESRLSVGSLFWAVGELGALGFSAFGIEDARVDGQLATAYRLLDGMRSTIARAQAVGRCAGVLLEDGETAERCLGDFTITVQGSRALLRNMLLDAGVPFPPDEEPEPVSEVNGDTLIPAFTDRRAFGLLLLDDDGSLLIVGQGLTVDVGSAGKVVEIDEVRSGQFYQDVWRPDKVLNGDERLQIVPMTGLGAARVTLLMLTE